MKWLDRSLVISPVYYGLCQSEKEFRKELKRLGIPKNDRPDFISHNANATVHFLESEGKTSAIVCIDNKEGRTHNQVCGLLVHEAVHIWQEIRTIIGEKNPSAEFEAYSIQTIAQKLIEAYWSMR
jgi:hypothetical protein